MKKTLLSTVLLVFSIISFNAQTIEFTVEAPAGIAGPYGFSSTNDVAGWGSPDLLDTANAVMDTLMFVDDGTAGTNPQGIQCQLKDVTHLLMTFLVKLLLFTETHVSLERKF